MTQDKLSPKYSGRFIEKLGQKERTVLYSLILFGLEYGDNDRDGKEDNKLIENEFPALFILLQSKMIDE